MNKYGVDVSFHREQFSIEYGAHVIGPPTEVRTIDSIRSSLLDPAAHGPEKLYAIAMDVYHQDDEVILKDNCLLLGIVAYNEGRIGKELVRSQGHIHKISSHSGWSPPEIFEIWEGTAIIYMQESAQDNPGNCYAVLAKSGDWVIVPPGWPHMVINADVTKPMVFGAICDRGYEGFDYKDVRAHGGLAYFPLVSDNGSITWEKNTNYSGGKLIQKSPDSYDHFFHILGDNKGSLYEEAVRRPEVFSFVPYAGDHSSAWHNFLP